MSTNAETQTDAVIAKDLLIAMLSMPNRIIALPPDSKAASEEVANAFEVIFNRVKSLT